MNLKDRVRAFLDAYTEHDIGAMLEYCSQEGTFHYVPEGEQGTGSLQDAAKLWRLFTIALPDFKVDIQRLISAEDSIVIVETMQGGTQAQDIAQIANKDRLTWCPHLYIFEFNEQKQISHITCYWDYDTIYRQLGHTETHS